MNDSASKQWMCICPKCNRQRSLRSVGGTIVGTNRKEKRAIGWCTHCKRIRLIKVVRGK